MRASRRELDRRQLRQPVRLVLPAPPADAAPGAVLQVDEQRAGRADAVNRRSVLVRRVGELHPHGVVPLRIAARAQPQPHVVRRRRCGGERRFEILRRRRQRGIRARPAVVGTTHIRTARRSGARHPGPTPLHRRHVRSVEDDIGGRCGEMEGRGKTDRDRTQHVLLHESSVRALARRD